MELNAFSSRFRIPRSLIVASFFTLPIIANAKVIPIVETNHNDSVQIESEIPGSNADTISLGTAYHSKKRGFFGLHAIQGDINETYGNTEAEIRIGVDLSFNQIVDMINGSVEASFDIPAVKVEAGASYAKETAADEYTGSYTIFASVTPKKRVLIPATENGYQPTAAAMQLANAYPGDLFNQLGDEFVTSIEYGSFLLVNMKIEFKNSKDKRDIGGHLGVDWVGKVKVGGSLQMLDDETKQSVKISISAVQHGGIPSELTQIIPDGLMQCSLLNPAPCFELFEEAVTYMKTRYINQFDSLDRYNVRKVTTRRYEESGPQAHVLVPTEYTDISFLSKMSYKYMGDAWIESLLHKRRAENILAYYSANLTAAQKNRIKDIAENARYNAFIYADGVAYCDRNPLGDYCANAEADARNNIKPYNPDDLNLTD